MDIFAFDATTFLSFLLTLIRISLVVFLLPFFGGGTIPQLVKASFCLVLTLAIFPQLSLPAEEFPLHPLGILLLVVSELIMGLTLGLTVHFIFVGIQTGGEILAFQMGFTMATLADPSSGANASVISFLLYNMALIVFLLMDGHLHLLRALTDSFALVPAGGWTVTNKMSLDIFTLSGEMFVLALKVAAPAMAALFTVELALALMGRAAPQMNLMTLGFPIKIAVGFFLLSLLFTIMSNRMETMVIELGPRFDYLLKLAH